MLESAVQSRTQVEFCRVTGGQIFRNNSGACEDKTGRLIRYGLGNVSAQHVRRFASSDLIGVTPVVIQPHHVGQTLGVFTALECKKSDWHMTPSDARAQAQQRWMQLVLDCGGIASFITDPAQVQEVCRL